MFHIDGDKVLDLDTERLLALPDEVEAVQLAHLEALSQWEWPDDEVTVFKRLLTPEELNLLHLLGMLERPANDAYFRGHTVGKAGLRVSSDGWFDIHRVVDGQPGTRHPCTVRPGSRSSTTSRTPSRSSSASGRTTRRPVIAWWPGPSGGASRRR